LAALLVLAPLAAQAHGGRHGGPGYRPGGGPYWGGVGLGIGVGIGLGGLYYGNRYGYGDAYPWAPVPGYGVVLASPPVVYVNPPVQAVVAAAPLAPEPVIYPRNGQSAAQTEADRQDCNRWATTQSAAMADASVFHRATLACMDGRGYTLK
jgi:hypothetical protein